MLRLAETQPSAQRTAGAKSGRRGAQEQVSPVGTMTAKGGYIPFDPSVIEGAWRPLLELASLHSPAAVAFIDREYCLKAGLSWTANSVCLPVNAAVALPPVAATLCQLAQALIVPALGLASRERTTKESKLSPAILLFALTVHPSARQQKTVRIVAAMDPVSGVNWLPRAHRRRERELPPSLRLLCLATSPSGPEASDCRFAEKTADHPILRPATPCLPVSPLTALTPPPKEDTDEADWTLFETSALSDLVAAASYSSIQPIVPDFIKKPAAGQTQSIASTPPPAIFCSAPEPAPSRQPAPSIELHPLDAPLRAVLSGGGRAASQAIETPVSLRLPEWRAAVATGCLETREIVLPVLPPAVIPGLTFVAIPARAKAVGGSRPRLPKRNADWPARHALFPCEILLAVLPPDAALWNGSVACDASWVSTGMPEQLPVSSVDCKSFSPFVASGVSVPAPEAAGVHAKAIIAPAWIAPAVDIRPPSSCVSSVGRGMAIAGQVACDLRPDPVDAVHRPHSLQTLSTVLRLRFPRHSRRLVSHYGGAECVPLSPPGKQPISWRPAIVCSTDLAPDQVFPKRAKPAQSCTLRNLPIRLYPVPRAKPMARPADGKPRSLGMDLWASVPSILAACLRFDDGRPRPKHVSKQRFGQELRDRFAQNGLRRGWTNVCRLPSDLKWITIVVPLILGIWILARPVEPAKEKLSIPSEVAAVDVIPAVKDESQAAVTPVSAPPPSGKHAASLPADAPALLPPVPEPGRWEILTTRIAGRASVNLVEDFRNGLSQWGGRGEWTRTWSYDRSGTVRPGNLAIFQPTVALRDYVVEMKASIDRRSIQWLVRASSPQNYQFARLNVTPGSPLTALEFERWTVIDGRMGRVTRLPLPHAGANQTLYSIRVDVNGDSITTYLQDQVIDTFNDPRLQDGGVGLIGAHDDRPRIYGINVTHQNDFLGKLCSFLVPPPINSQGSD